MIFGIAGAAYSGKSELARMMFDMSTHTSKIIPFAKGVKDVAKWFGWDGKKDDKGRRFLQIIGTDVGRAYNPLFWVDKWEKEALLVLESVPDAHVFTDDVRFENEVNAIRGLGGIIIKVNAYDSIRLVRAQSKGEELPPAHASEVGINDWDTAFSNNHSLENLKHLASAILEEHTKVKGEGI